MQGTESGEEDELALSGPTFAGYSESRLKALLRGLDDGDPNDRKTIATIRRRLDTLSNE